MGATLVLDSRYITGLSDGNAIGSWPDKSGNGYDPTQATAAAKPTYKTAIQGGNPVARFDGGDSLYKDQNLSTVNALTVLAVCSFTNNTTRYTVFDAKNTGSGSFQGFVIEQNTFNTAGQKYGFYTSNGAFDSATATSSGMKIISTAANTTASNTVVDTTTYRVQGVTSALTAKAGSGYANLTAVNGFMVGSFNNAGSAAFSWHNGDIAQIIVLPSETTGATMKRLEHAAAYSFKIACS
jgi:hypothetical protein